MVDLPSVPRRLVTLEAPKSSLTRADLEAPYAALARAGAEGADALDDVAKARAADAGARAVQVGPDGQLTVDRVPVFGPAAAPYERAVRLGAVAQADTSADRRLNELADEFRQQGDPGGFLTAANAYRDQTLANFPLGEAARETLRRQMDNRITQTHSGLLREHQDKTLRRSVIGIGQRIKTLGDEAETLARRGGVGPEFEDRFETVRMLYDSLVNNPLIPFPKEKADAAMDELRTRVEGAAVHERMEKIYRGEIDYNGQRGMEGARSYLRDTVRNLDGRVKQLDKIERSGLAWLRTEEAGMRGERDAISREWTTAKSQIATLPREALDDMELRALQVGNTRVASDVAAHRSALDINAQLRGLPVQDQVAIARSGGPEIDSAIDAAAERYGVDKNTLRLFARIESGFNPRAQTRSGTYKGLFQMSDAEFQRYGGGDIFNPADNANAAAQKLAAEASRFQQKFGRAPEAWELYLTHQQGEGGFAAHQANPSAPAWQNMAATAEGRQKGERWAKAAIWGNIPDRDKQRFGSVDNVTSQQFMDIWKARASGGPVSSELMQGRSGLLARGMLLRDLNRDLTARIDAVGDRVKRGEIPEPGEIADLVALGSVSANPQQRRRVAELAAIAEGGAAFQKLSAPDRDAAISAMEERLRSGSGSQIESDLTQTLRTAGAAIDKAYKDDPYGAFYRFGQGEALPALDFGNLSDAAAILAAKVKQQPILREQERMGPVSVLRPAEAEAFRGTLANGDARTVAGTFALLGQLPDDMLAATLKDAKVRAGIVAATHTTDPAKLNAVMSALDTWYQRDPGAFNARFGEDVWHKLVDWQGNLRYRTPEEQAEAQRRALDPAQAEQRKRNIAEGQRLARLKTVDQVTADLGSAWGITPTAIATNITGSQALPPADEGTRQALMGDYESVFEQRYAATLDKDQAHQQTIERLRTKWARSDINGGRIMLRAPELVYPAIEGSHDWMRPQIESAIAEQMGVPQQSMEPAMAPGMQATQRRGERNWDYILVPDAKTESAAQRYDRSLPAGEANAAPTYLVMVKDNRRQTPRWEPLRNADGQMMRMGFDPNPETEAARLRLQQAHGRRTPAVLGGGGF